MRRVLGVGVQVIAVLLGAFTLRAQDLIAFGQHQANLPDFRNNLAPYVNSPEHAVEQDARIGES